jgi:hypothetical protein
MNLPLIVEIAIGLIFIYLILSLLASEIQEILTTLLQWRAKHLKESIEMLLSGGAYSETTENTDVRQEIIHTRELANHLYRHPLIKTLNFEQQGGLAGLFRKPMQWIDQTLYKKYNQMQFGEDIFAGSNSGPSYIPSENFAFTILETLQIPRVIREINHRQILQLQQDTLTFLNEGWDGLVNDPNISQEAFLYLDKERLVQIIQLLVEDIKNNRISVSEAIRKIDSQLEEYLNLAEYYLPDSQTKTNFIAYLNAVRQKIYLDDEQAAVLDSHVANLRFVVQAYQQIKQHHFNDQDPIHQIISQMTIEDQGVKETLLQRIDHLPENLINTLASLADQASATKEDIETQLTHYQQQLETWFDQGMARAGGVYKRNATGITFMIGFLLAIAFNADTFHIADRLVKDPMLREIIIQQAEQVQENTTDPNQKKLIDTQLRDSLDQMPLPLGWTQVNLDNQAQYRENVAFGGSVMGWLRQGIGWIITGVAITMGSPFWFDLIGKFINIKNTGKKT